MAPVANAGPDQTVDTKTPVQLDGSASTFDRCKTLDYAWTRTGGTQGADVSMTGANTVRPSFVAGTLESGAPDVEYVFTLTGMGSDGMEDTDTVRVTVAAVFVDILVSPSDLTVHEGGASAYQVKLSESPG